MSHTLTEKLNPTDGMALQTPLDTGHLPAPKRHYLEVTHMRIKSHSQQIRLVHILIVIVLLTGFITSKPNVTFSRATSNTAAISCPPPTIEQNQICVLEPPVTNPNQTKFEVKKTIELTSDMTLDCKNRTLVPDQSAPNQGVGKGIDPNWPTGRSTPEVAIFLTGARNVTIKNCVIQDFDFGIYAINSKLPSGFVLDPKNPQPKLDRLNRIQGNSITARFVPITLMHQDNTLVQNNFLTYKTVGGKGIVVERDSDLNQIVRNIITTNFVEVDALLAPGPSASSNAIQKTGAGIVVGQMSPTETTLLNVVVNNQLYQVSTTSNPDPQPPPTPLIYSGLRELSEYNLVEGNSITGPSNPFAGVQNAIDGIALPVAIGTTISNNTISNVTFGMRVGIQPAEDTKGVIKKAFPNKCRDKTTRFCLTDLDCNISTLDPPPVDKCTVTPADTKFASWLSIGTTIDENKIYGPFVSAITFAGKDTTVIGNTIIGPQTPINGPLNAAIPGALFLVGRHALESATVTQNSVSNVYIALSLQSTFTGLNDAQCILRTSQLCPGWSTCLGAKINLNDFTNYTIAVQTNNDYKLFPASSVLSFDNKGNYWGDNCADRKNVFKRNGDSVSVTDCHPFTKPVAHAMPNALPPMCAP
jgi:hypothetical protein